MDPIDVQLLTLLQEDGRMSISELSQQLSLSRPSVAERLKRLQEKEIIDGFYARVTPAAVGRKLMVMIELSDVRAPLRELEQFLEAEPVVIECHRATGHVHYYIKAALNDMDGLTFLIERLMPYGNTRTSILLSTPVEKRVMLPSEY
ncbi:Lrp/AsnC family transcriptional regulator [Paenibacillus yanchengensis]|uniref:Lrp/AsnC family transcriptional regulator n=1 Tax=Paenibacillus yanchengensis TaxID=2035833 RepID=A0ABW4YHR9_9BACL